MDEEMLARLRTLLMGQKPDATANRVRPPNWTEQPFDTRRASTEARIAPGTDPKVREAFLSPTADSLFRLQSGAVKEYRPFRPLKTARDKSPNQPLTAELSSTVPKGAAGKVNIFSNALALRPKGGWIVEPGQPGGIDRIVTPELSVSDPRQNRAQGYGYNYREDAPMGPRMVLAHEVAHASGHWDEPTADDWAEAFDFLAEHHKAVTPDVLAKLDKKEKTYPQIRQFMKGMLESPARVFEDHPLASTLGVANSKPSPFARLFEPSMTP
jgi:hypothetical protein